MVVRSLDESDGSASSSCKLKENLRKFYLEFCCRAEAFPEIETVSVIWSEGVAEAWVLF